MRIVYVTRNYSPVIGGAERHVKELAERHAARGHAVTVFTQRTSNAVTGALDPSLPDQEHIGGVQVIRFPPEDALRRRLDRLLTWDHAADRVEAAYRATLDQGRRSTSRRERASPMRASPAAVDTAPARH